MPASSFQLHLVTQPSAGLADAVADALAGGVDWVQLRDKSGSAASMSSQARTPFRLACQACHLGNFASQKRPYLLEPRRHVPGGAECGSGRVRPDRSGLVKEKRSSLRGEHPSQVIAYAIGWVLDTNRQSSEARSEAESIGCRPERRRWSVSLWEAIVKR